MAPLNLLNLTIWSVKTEGKMELAQYMDEKTSQRYILLMTSLLGISQTRERYSSTYPYFALH